MVRTRTGSYPGRPSRTRPDRGLRLLTAAVMVVLVIAVYSLVVVGGSALLFGTASPSLVLSVLATAIVAIAFEPVRRLVGRILARALHQDRLEPYEVLSRFSSTVTGQYPAEELPSRVARVLAEGTGTDRAEVWLSIHGRLELAASWPTDSFGPATTSAPVLTIERPGSAPTIVAQGGRRSLAVRERGELLGALTVHVRGEQQLTPVEERLFAGLAAQSGLMFRVTSLRTELQRELGDLGRRTDDLRRARRDLLSRQDAERQRLERNIHDGAQQEVIALLVNLRLIQTLLGRNPERARALLADQAAAAGATIGTLTQLSRGLYPRLLTDAGPVAALRAAVASGPIPVELTSDDLPRLATDTEAGVYFCALEAVQNATKHSGASRITIDIQRQTEHLVLTVSDDGRGFQPGPSRGGLSNIRDRIESLQGSVTITSAPGRGTTVVAVIPLASRPVGQAGPAVTASIAGG